jgi:hypothetical protein
MGRPNSKKEHAFSPKNARDSRERRGNTERLIFSQFFLQKMSLPAVPHRLYEDVLPEVCTKTALGGKFSASIHKPITTK